MTAWCRWMNVGKAINALEVRSTGVKDLVLLVHIDFSLFDDSRDKPLLLWVECKATTTDIEQTYKDYKEQLLLSMCLVRNWQSS